VLLAFFFSLLKMSLEVLVAPWLEKVAPLVVAEVVVTADEERSSAKCLRLKKSYLVTYVQ